jgi:glycosyltransferase involved in cell wall biosynthesis
MLGPVPPPFGGIASVIDDWIHSPLAEEYSFEVFPTVDGTAGEHRGWSARRIAGIMRFARFAWKTATTRYYLVHIHSSTAFWPTMVYMLIAHLTFQRLILHIHGSNWDRFYQADSRFKRFLKRKVLDWPEVIVVLSSMWVRRLTEIGVRTEIRIVRNFLKDASPPAPSAVTEARGELGLRDDDFIVLTVAAICPWKGIFLLMEAAPEVIRQCGSVRFVLAGGEEEVGAMTRLKDIVEKGGLCDHVKVLGEVERDKVPVLLGMADLFVLPSWLEAMPISLLEAMRAGVPVIATRVGAVPDMLEDGKSGMLIEPRQPGLIAEAVLKLINDADYRQALAIAGKRTFEERFELSQVLKDMKALYRKCQ